MSNFMQHSYQENPVSLHISRSTFNRPSRTKTSFNEGRLIPFYLDEVLPGDTFNVKTNCLIRLSNPAVKPVMDDMYLDYYYFFVPSRILWSHFEEMHGENKSDAWTQRTEFVVPISDSGSVARGSFLDYLGLPEGCTAKGLSLLPYAAYLKVWNDWFRDENFQSPLFDLTVIYNAASGSSPVLSCSHSSSASVLQVNRYHDYFSSCLPSPQKGTAVTLPLGTTAPLNLFGEVSVSSNFVNNSAGTIVTGQNLVTVGSTAPANPIQVQAAGGAVGIDGSFDTADINGYADLATATAANINAFREAFQLQKLFERDARGGTRYTEMLKAHYGVSNGDARMQRPEFLGGKHQLLNMSQVAQTNYSTATGNGLGQVGAFSVTGTSDGSFVKSFTEFGYVIGVACVRVKHSYAQGINKMFTRKRRFDFYYPGLANIGEQPVYKKELYGFDSALDSEVFGFNEAWADYRYKPDIVSGMLRPGVSTDMTAWTYSDNYSAAPSLSDTWLKEYPSNIDQTLAVPAATADQFLADFAVVNKATRPMPLYSVPGLIDHN